MKRAFSCTDRLPQEVDFLELHATGMKMQPCDSPRGLPFCSSQVLLKETRLKPTGSAETSKEKESFLWEVSKVTLGERNPVVSVFF